MAMAGRRSRSVRNSLRLNTGSGEALRTTRWSPSRGATVGLHGDPPPATSLTTSARCYYWPPWRAASGDLPDHLREMPMPATIMFAASLACLMRYSLLHVACPQCPWSLFLPAERAKVRMGRSCKNITRERWGQATRAMAASGGRSGAVRSSLRRKTGGREAWRRAAGCLHEVLLPTSMGSRHP